LKNLKWWSGFKILDLPPVDYSGVFSYIFPK